MQILFLGVKISGVMDLTKFFNFLTGYNPKAVSAFISDLCKQNPVNHYDNLNAVALEINSGTLIHAVKIERAMSAAMAQDVHYLNLIKGVEFD